MKNDIIMQSIAAKISENIKYPITFNSPENNDFNENQAGLYFDGITCDSENLRKYHNFKFRFFAFDNQLPIRICVQVEKLLRTMIPETFTDSDGNEFNFRYCRSSSISAGVTNLSGIVWFFAELKFSIEI